MKTKHLIPLLALSALISSNSLAQSHEDNIQKDEQDVETIVITASPLNRTVLESSTPVTILSGEELDQNQAATLGETLKNVPGVHSSFFGPVASSPIIRGLDGPRIKVLQNGLDASDASRVGPDHQVATETSTATQIEVLRGPATLLYGSGAIGGVVNVVDNRLPALRKEGLSGEVFAQYDNVADAKTLSTGVDVGSGDFVLHVDGYKRKTDDYKIPVPADINAEGGNSILANSSMSAHGYNLGGGWITDDTRVALSYGRMDSQFGLPVEEDVFIKLKQNRIQGVIDWSEVNGFFKDIHLQSAYTDYEHTEFEGEEVGTTFKNESIESRLWAEHKVVAGWKGVAGLHYNQLDFSALGEEAFTPPTKTNSMALFLLEEQKTGLLLWQLGARVEHLKHQVDNDFYAALEQQNIISFDHKNYTAVSSSVGLVWNIDNHHSLALNYAYSQRAPSSSEIFSFGPHIGSQTYEIGGGFTINGQDDVYTINQASQNMKKEKSNNIDLSYRYSADIWNANVNLFHNQVGNYIFEQHTGLVFAGGELITQAVFSADELVNGESEDETDGLPVVIFQQQDATLYGFEVQLDVHLTDQVRWEIFSDYTRVTLDDGGNVPRIPPMRVGSSIHYERGDWHSEIEVVRNSRQDKIAAYETSTDGYTMLSASANYYVEFNDVDLTFYLKANNLTNEEGRVHSSYIKDQVPLSARSFSLGIRANF